MIEQQTIQNTVANLKASPTFLNRLNLKTGNDAFLNILTNLDASRADSNSLGINSRPAFQPEASGASQSSTQDYSNLSRDPESDNLAAEDRKPEDRIAGDRASNSTDQAKHQQSPDDEQDSASDLRHSTLVPCCSLPIPQDLPTKGATRGELPADIKAPVAAAVNKVTAHEPAVDKQVVDKQVARPAADAQVEGGSIAASPLKNATDATLYSTKEGKHLPGLTASNSNAAIESTLDNNILKEDQPLDPQAIERIKDQFAKQTNATKRTATNSENVDVAQPATDTTRSLDSTLATLKTAEKTPGQALVPRVDDVSGEEVVPDATKIASKVDPETEAAIDAQLLTPTTQNEPRIRRSYSRAPEASVDRIESIQRQRTEDLEQRQLIDQLTFEKLEVVNATGSPLNSVPPTLLGKLGRSAIIQEGILKTSFSSEDSGIDSVGGSTVANANANADSEFLPFSPNSVDLKAANSVQKAEAVRSTERNLPTQVINKVARALQKAVPGDSTIRLQLNPIELGNLSIEISFVNGVMSGKLKAQSAQTMQLLQEGLDGLKTRLAEHGISIENLDIELGSQSDFSRGSDQRQAQSFEQQQGRSAGFFSDSDSSGQRRQPKPNVNQTPEPKQPIDNDGRWAVDVVV